MASGEVKQNKDKQLSITVALCISFGVAGVVLTLIAISFLTALSHGHARTMAENNSRQLGLLMMQYALDHEGQFPDGTTSTEAFQKLINAGILTSPNMLVLSLSKKDPVEAPAALTAANVDFDVIAPMDQNDPDWIPLLISSGWKVTLEPGSVPVLVDREAARAATGNPGMVVFRKGGSVEILSMEDLKAGKLIPADAIFPRGKTYRQLRP